MPPRPRSGFTLIELSIVLVIIGLIVGGVLIGMDLIKVAEIRATTGQKEKYDTAVRVFELKYGGKPGDLSPTSTAAFGMFNTGMTGTAGLGDSNGLIQDEFGAANTNSPSPYSEALAFWRHLSDAQLIEGNFGETLASKGYPPANQTVAQMNLWMPATKIGRGVFAVISINGKNYYEIYTGLGDGSSALYTTALPTWYTIAPILTPLEAKSIDQKIDDGMPASGIVRAANGDNDQYLGVYPALSEHCTNGSTPDNYNVGGTYATAIVCNLILENK